MGRGTLIFWIYQGFVHVDSGFHFCGCDFCSTLTEDRWSDETAEVWMPIPWVALRTVLFRPCHRPDLNLIQLVCLELLPKPLPVRHLTTGIWFWSQTSDTSVWVVASFTKPRRIKRELRTVQKHQATPLELARLMYACMSGNLRAGLFYLFAICGNMWKHVETCGNMWKRITPHDVMHDLALYPQNWWN